MLEENQFLKQASAPVTSLEPPPAEQNYTSSQRRLKKMAQDFPFEPPTSKQIQQKINVMRTKLSARDQIDTEGRKDKGQKQIRERHKTQPSRNTLQEEKSSHIGKPLNEVARAKSLLKMSKVTDHLSKNEKSLSYKNPFNCETYQNEQLVRDKQKYPIKYKIICDELGFKEEKVHKLKHNEVQRLKEEYQKNKGLEYLREGTLQAKITEFKKRQILKNEENFKPQRRKDQKSLIHHIFGTLSDKKEVKRSFSTKQLSKKDKKLRQLTEEEQMLGHLVFQRVRKHLKDEQKGVDYFKRVHSEKTIDDALVNFLRVKIKRAEVAMK